MKSKDLISLIEKYLLNSKEFIADIGKYLKVKIKIEDSNSHKLEIINYLLKDRLSSQFLTIIALTQIAHIETRKGFEKFDEEWKHKLDKFLGIF